MYTLNTYLSSLRNKVFKLLPMREACDRGEDNHLHEYLEHLCDNFSGSFDRYPELANMREVVEVYNDIAFLKNNTDIEFAKWRSFVLRSTRLIQAALAKIEGV